MYGRDLSRPNLGMDSVAAAAAAASAERRSTATVITAAVVAKTNAVVAEQADEDQDDDPGIATTKTVHLSFLLSLLTLPYYVSRANVLLMRKTSFEYGAGKRHKLLVASS